MVFTVMPFLPTNLTSPPCGPKLGVAGNHICSNLKSILHYRLRLQLFYLIILLFFFLGLRFNEFGGTIHQRPVQDLAFAVARFIQKGGSYINYYMVSSKINSNAYQWSHARTYFSRLRSAYSV